MAGNSNSGRNRKPTAKLKLHGTFRKDRQGKRLDDSTLPAVIAKPVGMIAAASEFWDRVVPGLAAAGIAKECDTSALQGICDWWAIYQSTDKIYPKSCAWKCFINLASKFGMTPVDRAKLAAEPKPAISDFDKDISKLG